MFNDDIFNKMNALITLTGYLAVVSLCLLLFTPLSVKFKLVINQRILGLSIFYISLIHFILYIIDNSFDIVFLWEDFLYRDYISVGYIALILFIPMYLTSFDYFKNIFKNWKKIHRVIYLITILILIHIYYVIKADYMYLYTFAFILLFIFILKIYKYNNKHE